MRPFLSWDEWPEATRAFFQAQRIAERRGTDPARRTSSSSTCSRCGTSHPTSMEVYRRHYRNPGPARMPMLAWTRDLPIAGEPADVVEIVDSYARWLAKSPLPKLFIDAEPGGVPHRRAKGILPRLAEPADDHRARARTSSRRNAPQEVGQAAARFVAKVLAGQIA